MEINTTYGDFMESYTTYKDVTESNFTEDHIKFQILVERNNSAFYYSLPAMFMIIIVMVVGLVCNTIMIVTYQIKLKGNSTYFFVFIMAILDLINCLMLPFEINELRNPYMYSTFTLCKVHRFFSFASDLASGNTIIAISFDRYFRFARPHKKFSLRKAKGIVVIDLVVSLFLCLFALYIYGEEEVAVDTKAPITGTKCGIHKEAKATIVPSIFKAIIMVFFFGGVIVITTVYTLLWIRFKQWDRKRQERTTFKPSNSNTGQNNETCTEQLHYRYKQDQNNLGLEQSDVSIQEQKTCPNTEEKNNTFQDHQTYHSMEQTDGIQNQVLIDSSSGQLDISNPFDKLYCDVDLDEKPEQRQEANEENNQGYFALSETRNTLRTAFGVDEIRASTLPLRKRITFGHNVSVLSGNICPDERQSSNISFSQMNKSDNRVSSTMSLNLLKIRDLVSKVNVFRLKYPGHPGKIRRASNIKMKSVFKRSSIWTIARFGRSLKINRSTIMFLVATVSYVIFRIPYIIISALKTLNPGILTNMEPIEIVMYTIFAKFLVLSYATNPLIYSFLNPKIRSECVGLVCSFLNLVYRGKRNNVSSIAQSSSIVGGNESRRMT
ncbi:hypothetical protein ACJMK2_010477 [Sinanodonta woodiana]|uniref:G-protein coupled receptors family 1 profile domain-containing protein n=1 Tax=Sinanodonta woodiana TaxID=1069815 RepID=A0ABD3VGV1_SINWO